MSRAILALTAASLLAGCGRKPEPPTAAQAPPSLKPAVTVLNADVLVIQGKHYRLANGYAPQPVPDARCWAEAIAARQATRVVADMVAHAGSVTATPTGDEDEYARAYAIIHIDGADLGQVLFRDGLAAQPPKGRFEWCDPISRNEAGAPNVFSMMELAPGRAPGR
jgi:endonuclease YncB( thermonuclease family)